MLPSFSFNDKQQSRPGYPKLSSKRLVITNKPVPVTSHIMLTNVTNVLFSQLRSRSMLPLRLPTLFVTIFCVSFMGPKKQMARADTSGIVAVVANYETTSYSPVNKSPRISTTTYIHVVNSNLRLFDFRLTHPNPTTTSSGVYRPCKFINVSPESLLRSKSLRKPFVYAKWHDSAPLAALENCCGRQVGFLLFGCPLAAASIIAGSNG